MLSKTTQLPALDIKSNLNSPNTQTFEFNIFFSNMKKRTSQPQEQKSQTPRQKQTKPINAKVTVSPLTSLGHLIKKTECMSTVTNYQKQKINRILAGSNQQTVKYRETEFDCCYQEYFKRYYQWNETKGIYTDLIRRCALVKDITFVDFKIRNFRIMNHYGCRCRCRGREGKDEVNQTALDQTKFLREMEINAHRVVGKPQGKASANTSTSFINGLLKNIQKMVKNTNYRDNTSRQMDTSHVMSKHEMNTPNISRIINERVHTTPSEPMVCDNYGLFDHLSGSNKMKNNENIYSSGRIKEKGQPAKPITRFNTEYDTEYIHPEKWAKGKPKLTSRSKKSFSKKKGQGLGLSKSPQLRSGLKLKR